MSGHPGRVDVAGTVFQPGVNEELAATAIWGTQQLEFEPQAKKFDGVFGLWYGKGPGVDRSGDVFRHSNLAGTSKNGGVIALMGEAGELKGALPEASRFVETRYLAGAR